MHQVPEVLREYNGEQKHDGLMVELLGMCETCLEPGLIDEVVMYQQSLDSHVRV